MHICLVIFTSKFYTSNLQNLAACVETAVTVPLELAKKVVLLCAASRSKQMCKDRSPDVIAIGKDNNKVL